MAIGVATGLPGQGKPRERVLSALELHAREQPARTAIARRKLDGSFEETSYATLLEWVRAYARVLSARAPEDGAIVPLCLGRTAEAVAAMLGTLLSGRAFCIVNPRLRLPQIERILADTRAPFAFVDATGLSAFKGGVLPESLAAKTHWVVVRDGTMNAPAENAAKELAKVAAMQWFELGESTKGAREDGPPIRALEGALVAAANDSVAACLFTSGSTGAPKGVLVGMADLLARARSELEVYGVTRSDVLLNLLPFSFDVGLNQLLCSVLGGAELVLLDSWLPLDIRRVITEKRVSGVSAVPSIWGDFMRANLAFDRMGAHRSLRYLTISGGDLTPSQHARVERFANGVGVFKTYGQTEAFRAACLRPHEYADRPSSVGRAYPGVNLYVVRNDGARASPGEVGEVVHAGLGVMLGYLGGDDPDHKLRDNPFFGSGDDNERAIFTGDLGFMDDSGYLFLRGRRDELIKRNGNRVYPGEVRNQLAAIPGVGIVEVVVARVDEEARLAGFVVPQANGALELAALKKELGARVPVYMIPDHLELVSELPRTASGKPDRPALAAIAEHKLSQTHGRADVERILADIAKDMRLPTFVYFIEESRARIQALRKAFEGRLGVSFAMKCNPHPAILKELIPSLDGLDISSRGELEAAVKAGVRPSMIGFTGPAKQEHDLIASVEHGIGEVIVESLREAELLSRIAFDRKARQSILVRIAPSRVPKGFGVNMAGRPCQFGIDEEDIDRVLPEIRKLPALEIEGFHLFSGTQCLKPDAIAENYGIFLEIAERTAERHGLIPKKLVLGSSLGIPYHEGDSPVSLAEVARLATAKLDSVKRLPRFAKTLFVLETGRYLLGEAGLYLVRVVSRKRSRGAEIAILDGGMNHHLGAAGHLGMAIPKNYRMKKIYSEHLDGPEREFDLYGPLCTSIDVIGRRVKLPGLEVGDVLAIYSSGAYALTASPAHFISHPVPRELMVKSAGGRLSILEMETQHP